MLTLLAFASLSPLVAPAVAGAIECVDPDRTTHTCRSMARYRTDGDGYISRDTAYIAGPARILLTIETKVFFRGDAICGTLDPSAAARASLTRNGKPVSSTEAAILRREVESGYAPMMGREICGTLRREGDDLVMEGDLGDGISLPPQRMIWIYPAGGWRLR